MTDILLILIENDFRNIIFIAGFIFIIFGSVSEWPKVFKISFRFRVGLGILGLLLLLVSLATLWVQRQEISQSPSDFFEESENNFHCDFIEKIAFIDTKISIYETLYNESEETIGVQGFVIEEFTIPKTWTVSVRESKELNSTWNIDIGKNIVGIKVYPGQHIDIKAPNECHPLKKQLYLQDPHSCDFLEDNDNIIIETVPSNIYSSFYVKILNNIEIPIGWLIMYENKDDKFKYTTISRPNSLENGMYWFYKPRDCFRKT